MGRTIVKPVQQPDEYSCGPASLKHALHIFGIRKSIDYLRTICHTTTNGTSTPGLVRGALACNLTALVIDHATLKHIRRALRYSPIHIRATLVCYLYDDDDNNNLEDESGHWATVSSYSASQSKIILFDSYTGKRKSYLWQDFRDRWTAYDLKRKWIGKKRKTYKVIKKWQPQQIVILAKTPANLPKFTIKTQKIFTK